MKRSALLYCATAALAALSLAPRAADCSATMGRSSGTGTTLRTTMTADALLDHYAKQLKDSGWVAAGDHATILGRTWTHTDSTGAPSELSITVSTPSRDAGCRDLSLQVRALRKPQ